MMTLPIKKIVTAALLFWACYMAGCSSDSFSGQKSEGVTLKMAAHSIDGGLPRYGLNLGGGGTWGAENLRANMLANPGFEAVIDRTLLIVSDAKRGRMSDDTTWLARPEGFWDGGTFDVRTGPQSGLQGAILHSGIAASGVMEIITDLSLEGLGRGDVVTLTRHADMMAAPMWWRKGGSLAISRETRPGSNGQQSVRLLAGAGERAELLHYFDMITDRAGKLRLINGKWRLVFWAMSEREGTAVRVYFGRHGSSPFLEQECVLKTTWQQCEFIFDADDSGPKGPLTLGISAANANILIDDAYLGELETGTAGFRHVTVETIKALRPGYLRDWQGQLGDTFNNRIADEYSHQPVRYRPGEHEIQYHYSLEDFFSLCADVRANPWVVAPTTLSDQEWRMFGEYLHKAANRYGFKEILVEFGNENWNAIFRPAGITDTAHHAQAADRAFRLIKLGSSGDKRLLPVINAQYVNPESPKAVAAASTEASRVAVAPYMLNTLDKPSPGADSPHQLAFREDVKPLLQGISYSKAHGKRISVYEVNFHTTWGSAEESLRNDVVSGASSGPALAKRLLQSTLAGVREQAVYNLSGFDSLSSNPKTLVKLWGITRDLTSPANFRPTGIALEMLNTVAGGDTHAVECTGDQCEHITGVVFHGGLAYAIVSSAQSPIDIMVDGRCHNGNITVTTLDGSDPAQNNEKENTVSAVKHYQECKRGRSLVRIPPLSLVVIDGR